MKTCENCGCRVHSNGCVNCNEELYILDQYHEQDMELPGEDTELMNKVDEQRWQMEQHLQNEQWESNMNSLYTYDEGGFCDGFTKL